MIKITLSSAVLIYFLLWLSVIIGLWIRELTRVKRYQWKLSNSRLFSCDNCHHAFLTKDGSNLTRCPKCNSICIARKRRGL